MTDLEMATNEDLIQELMGRTNFVGVFIYSPHENRRGVVHELIIHSTLNQKLTEVSIGEAFRSCYHARQDLSAQDYTEDQDEFDRET